MGGKAFIVVWWLISTWTVTGLRVRANARTNIVPRVYRNVPQGMYASAFKSASPYGAFSFHVPSVVPAAKAIQLKPLKEKSDILNFNGFLKDSYGNRIVEMPQSDAFKATFLQQFAKIQRLPGQPWAAASHHFAQGLAPPWPWATSPLIGHEPFAKPFAFPSNVQRLTPASDQRFQFVTPTKVEQDFSKSKLLHADQGFNWLQNEPEYRWLDDPHQSEYFKYESPRQRAPSLKEKLRTHIRHTVRINQNGQDVIVQVETKPPLPLLDLRLLEPLKFPNAI